MMESFLNQINSDEYKLLELAYKRIDSFNISNKNKYFDNIKQKLIKVKKLNNTYANLEINKLMNSNDISEIKVNFYQTVKQLQQMVEIRYDYPKEKLEKLQETLSIDVFDLIIKKLGDKNLLSLDTEVFKSNIRNVLSYIKTYYNNFTQLFKNKTET